MVISVASVQRVLYTLMITVYKPHIEILIATFCFQNRWSRTAKALQSWETPNRCNSDNHSNFNPTFLQCTICSCLGVSMLHHDGSSTVLPLCNSHYLAVYRFCNPERVCSVCGCGCKHYSVSAPQRFFPCPDPTRVEAFLHETVDFDSSLSGDDLLCYTCYKYANHIKQHSHFPQMQ